MVKFLTKESKVQNFYLEYTASKVAQKLKDLLTSCSIHYKPKVKVCSVEWNFLLI